MKKKLIGSETFLIYINTIKILRGGAVAARKAHNLEVAGSNPVPATKNKIKIKINLVK
jgi:hypothetical protein